MRSIYLTLLIVVLMTAFSFQLLAQRSGYINRQATSGVGRLVLDPNSDGYTSATTAGFANDDVANSELLFHGIRAYSIEPFGDLRRGPNHNFSDFVPDASGNGVYHHFSPAQNMIFRMRLGSIMPGSKGYSILLDTDGKFGATGPNADPNFQPTTTGTNGNPGFEIEIVLETNFRIAIYNVDGTSSPVMIKQYTNWQDMSQVSIAATNDDGDPDFFIDFYIPFSDLQAAPFNLTTASPIRLCATTVMAPKAATGGPRSDIYGTAGDTYEDFILGQPACNIFTTTVTCPTAMCTAAPAVNSPINAGLVTITGTWLKSALPDAAATANVSVYKNGGLIGSVPNVNSGSSWSLNGITLVNGDIITARAQATGETMCLTSNAVPASTCNSANRPATPVLTCFSGSKGIEGTNLSSGWTVHVDNITRAVPNDNVINTGGLFSTPTGTSPNLTWLYSGGCSTGAPLTSGSYKIYYRNNSTGCTSLPAYFCAAGNGGSALAGSLAVPIITTPANAVFTVATTSISGTTDANASVALYINSNNVQSTTASAGGSFSFTGLTLLAGQQLLITVELATGTVGTSKCSNQTAVYTVSCYTQPPLINADNNNQLTAGSRITGTSTDAAGTLIRIYSTPNTLVASTPVQANGTWSTGNAGTTPALYDAVAAVSYFANAQNGSCGISSNSGTYTASAPTAAGRCGSITGPVTAGNSTVSGTLTGSFSTSTVYLYLDGELIGTATTNGTLWGPITVNSTPSNTLYPNGELSIGVQETGKQEFVCLVSATKIICTPSPAAPVYTLSNNTVNQNQAVTCTISNAVTGTFYALSDANTGQSYGMGKWAPSDGNLVITTNAFTSPGTYDVRVSSTSLSGVTVCKAISASTSVTVNPTVLPLSLLEFKGKKQGAGNLLDWTTENEINVNRYEIERSQNGATFSKISLVSASGISNTQMKYSFADNFPGASQNFYRLKMFDIDGRFTYSNVVVLSNNKTDKITIEKIKPNPFTEFIEIAFTLKETQQLSVQVVDLSGRVAVSKSVEGHAGENKIKLDRLSALSPGIYFIKIISADAVLQQKVLKVN